MRKHIPNGITLLNMLCGAVAIVYGLKGSPQISSWLIFLAALLDFLDGFTARLLKVQSKTGKELDSFADLISFGLAPSVLLYSMLLSGLEGKDYNSILMDAIPFMAFLITLFSAIRLARFNTDERPKEFFYGLPTPANAILIASLPLILVQESFIGGLMLEFLKVLLMNPMILITLTLLLSILLISDIKLMSFKFTSHSWTNNRSQYLFMFTSLVLLLLFQFAGIPLIIFSYFIFSKLLRN